MDALTHMEHLRRIKLRSDSGYSRQRDMLKPTLKNDVKILLGIIEELCMLYQLSIMEDDNVEEQTEDTSRDSSQP